MGEKQAERERREVELQKAREYQKRYPVADSQLPKEPACARLITRACNGAKCKTLFASCIRAQILQALF